MGRHSTFLSREDHGVAAGALFYKVEGEKHCIMRKAEKGDTIDLRVSSNIATSTFILCVHFIDYSALPLLKVYNAF